MKQKEILLNSLLIDTENFHFTDDEIGDNHIATSIETPMRSDAFDLSDADKIKKIEGHFKEIMLTLGLDLTDDSLKGTPKRVAKMYVEEIFSGLNPKNEPQVALFENKFGYNEMLIEKNISFYSNCEHHFVPIVGKTHIAYISSGKVIGLSKLNRIVQYYAKRPQVQERLTMQIAKHLQKVLETEHVAIYIDAKHLCVSSRGVKDDATSTITSFYGGKFQEEATKKEFLGSIQSI
ncbi:GTP cyclohydrolase I FolE [Aquirufa nivalisilvae]|uniref:GTP cyclohydrolase 1 n=1 Tax=Aquirufa nivalisilvae TaxID=2516557 RepID=A0A2S2DVS9_9BACT|nr:GTP cyclohydrolase I FolE [Aquirufa nivalisilvae]AWL09382.1 GTP cyclohydrolase I [Aquirufa nivalisilvae]MCZ2480121.1 GTP cyclohydrolase I FolE [Aquirufa nivalisilvae]